MQRIISAMLILAGIVHLLPVVGVFGLERLETLYGLTFEEPSLLILMRHRAVLFGLLGAFLVYAGLRPALQPMALLAGFVSVISFLAIAWSVGGYNEAIQKIIVGDLVALVGLSVAAILYFIARRSSGRFLSP